METQSPSGGTVFLVKGEMLPYCNHLQEQKGWYKYGWVPRWAVDREGSSHLSLCVLRDVQGRHTGGE